MRTKEREEKPVSFRPVTCLCVHRAAQSHCRRESPGSSENAAVQLGGPNNTKCLNFPGDCNVQTHATVWPRMAAGRILARLQLSPIPQKKPWSWPSAGTVTDIVVKSCKQLWFHFLQDPPPIPQCQPEKKLATSAEMLLKAKYFMFVLHPNRTYSFLNHPKERFGVVEHVVIFL